MSQPWPESIRLVDMHYAVPGRSASYIVLEGGRATIIDATNSAVPHLQKELAAHGLTFNEVDYVIITHVHLDHAGGAGTLIQLCPNATLLAHPKAARHVISPERIIAGSRALYGDDFDFLYGEIIPVPDGRVRAMADGEELQWGERTFRFEHMLGHATHHFVIFDNKTNCVFTGDMLGMGRSGLLHPGASFCHCVTAPPDFDPVEAIKGARRIGESGVDFACIAHFGIFDDVPARAADVIASLERQQRIVQEAVESSMDDSDLDAWCIAQVGIAMDDHLKARGITDFETDRRLMDGDQMMNGLGCAHLARKMRKANAAV